MSLFSGILMLIDGMRSTYRSLGGGASGSLKEQFDTYLLDFCDNFRTDGENSQVWKRNT